MWHLIILSLWISHWHHISLDIHMNRLDGTNVFHLLCLTFPGVFMCETGSAGLRKRLQVVSMVTFWDRSAAWPKMGHARPLILLKYHLCSKMRSVSNEANWLVHSPGIKNIYFYSWKYSRHHFSLMHHTVKFLYIRCIGVSLVQAAPANVLLCLYSGLG